MESNTAAVANQPINFPNFLWKIRHTRLIPSRSEMVATLDTTASLYQETLRSSTNDSLTTFATGSTGTWAGLRQKRTWKTGPKTS